MKEELKTIQMSIFYELSTGYPHKKVLTNRRKNTKIGSIFLPRNCRASETPKSNFAESREK